MNNYTSPFIHNSISQNNEKYPTILMKNLGLDPSIFNNMQKCLYVFEKNPMKKVFSSNAVSSIPINEEYFIKNKHKKSYELEDKESYEKQELNKILDNSIYILNLKNSNSMEGINSNNSTKRTSAFEEHPQFDFLIQNINSGFINSNSVINSYNSINQSKFSKVVDINSLNNQGKHKYKLFHKCCFPGCNRTFSSSGWLKAHFKEHLKQLEKSKFSVLFKRFIYKREVFKNLDNTQNDNNKNHNINNKKKAIFVVGK